MDKVLLALHLLLAIGLVAVVLLQRSEGGGLGMGGGGSGSFMTGRGTANFLTRVTAGLATAFFITSISLTLLARQGAKPSSPLDLPSLPPMTKPGDDSTCGNAGCRSEGRDACTGSGSETRHDTAAAGRHDAGRARDAA